MKISCERCRRPFSVPPIAVARGRRFCSMECFRPRDIEDRFWRKVDRQETGCWVWIGAVKDDGYGSFQYPGGSLAHRFAYEHFVGPIPDGLTIDHLCRCTRCVNPAHLQPVPIAVNVLRGNGMAARYVRRATCIRGHALTGPDANITVIGGTRKCNICNRERAKEWREARR